MDWTCESVHEFVDLGFIVQDCCQACPLSRSLSQQDRSDRSEDDVQIEPERPVPNIVHVPVDTHFIDTAVPAGDLPHSG